MALFFLTDDSRALLESFKDKIEQKEKKGRIETWEVSGDGFGHTSNQWKDAAIMVPKFHKLGDTPVLAFYAKKAPGKGPIDPVAFAAYQGTLLQTFITHLSDEFKQVRYIDRRPK